MSQSHDRLLSVNEHHIIILMLRSWFIKILFCFSHAHTSKRKQPQPTAHPTLKKKGRNPIVSSYSSVSHTFSPPLKVSILRKIRCRIQSQTYDDDLVRLPLSTAPLKQRTIAAGCLNESQNCAEISSYQSTPSTIGCKQNSSLIAIDIDDDDFLHEQALIKLANSENPLASSSYRSGPRKTYAYMRLSRSNLFVQKQASDSVIFVHAYRSANNRLHNTNSVTLDSPINDISSSDSDVFSPMNRTKDKTWRLKIHDDLNKDGSRHNVMHKGSEESIRKRRQNKRAKRSAEKKRKIEERILKANQRWQKYSSIDYELVLFISRYYDQLPLCTDCRHYFVTQQTQFLAEDPRASLDYAADAVLHSPENKTMTMKEAAKARLIQDYDKQSDILFNLCDTCLRKCEQIRNELKEINFARKTSSESDASTISMMSMTTPVVKQQQPIVSPSAAPSNTITDLNQTYLNNLIQNHQIRLQQLYQQSQSIIIAQQYQPQLHHELHSCIKQMQYHCLELLRMQYPGYSLSFPYTPSSNPEHLSYRYQQSDDQSTDSESSSSSSSEDNHQSTDDRLTIETCHGLVEYCNAPLDDFIRGLQVLKCLSNFNRYST